MAGRAPREKRRKESSSESSSSSSESSPSSLSDPNFKYECKTVAKSASKWSRQHLEGIGIFYDKEAKPLSDITGLLQRGHRLNEMPEICNKLIDFTKTIWNFSLDLTIVDNEQYRLGKSEINRLKAEYLALEEDLRCQNSELMKQSLNVRVFNKWSLNLQDFFAQLKNFLRRWRSYSAGEGSYAQLFLQFSRIFLLLPEVGDACKAEGWIKGMFVESIPGIRFPSCYDDDICETVEIVTFAEIKDYVSKLPSCREEEFNIDSVPSDTLGKHGIELLLERKDSFFTPRVPGMICIGTKIIFTYLEMEETHYRKVKAKHVAESSLKSTIFYTKPYDYMCATDRSAILETLFWFGYVQTSGYQFCN